MYSEDDINSAVAAGVLSADGAAALRAHVSAVREMPHGDEESFRLVTSFNDIFVTIGVIILLIAVGSIGGAIGSPGDAQNLVRGSLGVLLPSVLVAGTAWFLAEIFTRRRRMALPSIVLLIAFVGAVLAASMSLLALPLGAIAGVDQLNDHAFEKKGLDDAFGATLIALLMLGAGILTVLITRLHWRRFMVPITIAAGGAALVGSVIGAIALADQVLHDGQGTLPILPLVLMAGLATFAVAMRWDMSDRARTTRRSDVAF